MLSRPRVAVFAALAVLTGCLPDRDNPFDGARRPDPVLRVLDLGTADGSCLPIATTGTAIDVVALASRGERCLVLDGELSTDPQDDALSFRFEGPGFEHTVSRGGLARAVLGSGYLLSLPVETSLPFTLRADDGRSAPVVASATLVLTNQRPVAVAPPSRTLEPGGLAFRPGEPYRVAFDASRSLDPDEEAVHEYCWTFEWSGEEVCSADPASPTFEAEIDAAVPARFRATLTVDDGSAVPDRTTAVVSVRDPNLWLDAASLLVRGDPLSESLDEPGTVAFFDDAGGTWRLLGTFDPGPGPDELRASRWPDGVEDVLVLPDSPFHWPGRMAVDPPRSRVWVGMGSKIGLFALSDANGITPVFLDGSTPSVAVESGLAGIGIPNDLLIADAAGNAWCSAVGADFLEQVDETGTVTKLDLPGDAVQGLAARPSSPEVWAAVRGLLDGPAAPAKLLRYADTQSPPQEILLDSGIVGTMAWSSADELWLFVDDGLHLVDVATLLALDEASQGEPIVLDAATLLLVPLFDVATDGSTYLADPATGALHIGSEGRAHHVERSGALTTSEIDGRPKPFAFDPVGGLWYRGAENEVRRGLLPSDGILGRIYSGSLLSSARDVDMGGVWAVTAAPRALVHYAEDGTLVRAEHAVMRDGELTLFPQLFSLRISPDGRWAWGYDHTFYDATCPGASCRYPIVRLDLAESPPVLHEVFETGPSFYLLGSILEPLAPVGFAADGGPWAWALLGGDLGLLSEEGFSVLFTVPGGELDVFGARSAASNALCLTTIGGMGTSAITRHLVLSSDGGGVSVDVTPLASDPAYTVNTHELISSAISTGPAGDTCWAIFPQDDGALVTLKGYPTDGVATLTVTEPGGGNGNHFPHVNGILTKSRSEVWFSWADTAGAEPEGRVTRAVFDTASGVVLERHAQEAHGRLLGR